MQNRPTHSKHPPKRSEGLASRMGEPIGGSQRAIGGMQPTLGAPPPPAGALAGGTLGAPSPSLLAWQASSASAAPSYGTPYQFVCLHSDECLSTRGAACAQVLARLAGMHGRLHAGGHTPCTSKHLGGLAVGTPRPRMQRVLRQRLTPSSVAQPTGAHGRPSQRWPARGRGRAGPAACWCSTPGC